MLHPGDGQDGCIKSKAFKISSLGGLGGWTKPLTTFMVRQLEANKKSESKLPKQDEVN